MDRRLRNYAWIALAAVALIVGVLIGVATGIADRIFGGPKPETIATASLESMRAQNRLNVFAARYVSVVTSKQNRLGGLVSSERTLILPGDVRYELDMSKLQGKDVTWNPSSKTLSVRLPEIEVAGPDVNINAVREYGGGGVLSARSRTCASRRRRRCRCGWRANPRRPPSNAVSRCRCRPPASRTSKSSLASPPKAMTILPI